MERIEDILKRESEVARRAIIYLDDNDKVVSKEKAVKFIATEYDKDDNVINEIFGKCSDKDIEEER